MQIGVPNEPKKSDDVDCRAGHVDQENNEKIIDGSDDCSDEDFDPDGSSGDESGLAKGNQEGVLVY